MQGRVHVEFVLGRKLSKDEWSTFRSECTAAKKRNASMKAQGVRRKGGNSPQPSPQQMSQEQPAAAAHKKISKGDIVRCRQCKHDFPLGFEPPITISCPKCNSKNKFA